MRNKTSTNKLCENLLVFISPASHSHLSQMRPLWAVWLLDLPTRANWRSGVYNSAQSFIDYRAPAH